MGIHESKRKSSSSFSSSASSSSSSSSPSSASRRRHGYTLIPSKKHSDGSIEADDENSEDLALCLASISLMALTGEGTDLPKPGSAGSSATTYDRRKRSSAASFVRQMMTSSANANSSLTTNAAAAKRNRSERILRALGGGENPTGPRGGPRSAGEFQFNKHVQMIDCLQNEDDVSSDWANMRSWLLWCLQNKLGDSEDSSRRTSDDDEDDDCEEEEEVDGGGGDLMNELTTFYDARPFTADRHPSLAQQLRKRFVPGDKPRPSFSSFLIRRHRTQETSFDAGLVRSRPRTKETRVGHLKAP